MATFNLNKRHIDSSKEKNGKFADMFIKMLPIAAAFALLFFATFLSQIVSLLWL